jgi:hypothetical protein
MTVTRAMKYSLNGALKPFPRKTTAEPLLIGLVGHVKNNFPAMYRLYEVLKARPEPPTAEELDITSGRKKLDPSAAGEYILKLEKASENIIEALQRQAERATVS